jgi:hypothetical protein
MKQRNDTMDVILPEEMMDILHSPYPEAFRAKLWKASLGMLRTLYLENPDHPKVHKAKLAMETAISKWSEGQVKDFLLNRLFEPPYSTDLQSRSPSELRQVLVSIYKYLFFEEYDPT